MWTVNKTQVFIKCVEDEGISKAVVESIERWATTSNLTPSKKSRRVYISPNKVFQIWSIKLPDPDYRKGSRGGFRQICFYVVPDKVITLDLIERRKDLGNKRERPKDQEKYTRYIEELKMELLSIHENNKP